MERLFDRFEKTLARQITANEGEINTMPSYGKRNEAMPAQEPTADQQEPGTGITPENPATLTPEETQSAGKSPMMPQQQQPKMVRMTAPDGTAILIPEGNVGAAEAMGASLAE